MDKVTVSSKGQIAIPKAIRTALNIAEGTKLIIHVRGRDLVLSKYSAWKNLAGAGAGHQLMTAFAVDKQRERKREYSRS
jgi:AbrB family looped-hinge helix DNA binding protein